MMSPSRTSLCRTCLVVKAFFHKERAWDSLVLLGIHGNLHLSLKFWGCEKKKVKPGFPSEETWESLQWIQVPSEAVFGGLPYARLCVHILFNFRHCLGVHVRLLGAARSVSPLILLGQVFCFFSQGRPEVENEKQCLRSWRNIMYAVFLPRELTTMGTTSMCHTSGTCWGSMAECCCHGNMLL